MYNNIPKSTFKKVLGLIISLLIFEFSILSVFTLINQSYSKELRFKEIDLALEKLISSSREEILLSDVRGTEKYINEHLKDLNVNKIIISDREKIILKKDFVEKENTSKHKVIKNIFFDAANTNIAASVEVYFDNISTEKTRKQFLIILSLLIIQLLIIFALALILIKILNSEFLDYKEIAIKILNGENPKNQNDFELIDYIKNLSKVVEEKNIIIEKHAKLAAIGQTAAMLAHDVRKPFASVKALLTNLNFFAKNPDKLELAQKDLGKTISCVENMIADIMDFSRENKYELKPTAIEPLIESSFAAFKSAIDNSKFNIEVKTKFTHINQPLLEEQKMLRVFQNILQNAFEAITIMGNKISGEILISTREAPEGRFIISIANNGPKFSKEAEENIFESFFTSGKNSGTGLGLASVKKIIELHNGTITAHNRQNEEGVEFVIELVK